MSSQTQKRREWALASVVLNDAYTDFILSRKALLCSPATIKWYSWTLWKVLTWFEGQGVQEPNGISARLVRAYLSSLTDRCLSDSYIHSHARVIRTMLRFFHNENYLTKPVIFPMPSIRQKRMPVLSTEKVQHLIKTCEYPRDKALVMFMVDTGARLSEILSMLWSDIEISSGVVNIRKGKGGKSRFVVIGIKTRRALLKYRRTISPNENSPLFQARGGEFITKSGLRSVLLRLGKLAGFHVSPHMLRRTFATLSLRSGMNVFHLQGLMGHSSLDMTKRYVQLLEADLVDAHQMHGPIDNL